jgi:Putative zinc-finger/FecR protein
VSRQNLDEAVDALRKQDPEPDVVRDAARRVFRNVFDSAYIPGRVDRIRGCADFEALIPAYLDRSLSPARLALFEDHISHCVECRHALQGRKAAEFGERSPRRVVVGKPKNKRLLAWGLAASLAAGTAVGITGAFNGLLPGQHAVRATVVSVQGTLYRMNEVGSTLLAAGAVIRNAEDLRTAKGSRAILRLLNGAQVEMGERSDVSVSRGWRGTSVEVERGRVIAQPAALGGGAYLLAAGDLTIPVRNAVLALDRGTKGSRVAVAKGSARVQLPGKTEEIAAGDQRAFGYHLANVSLESEFAWSSNADSYLALLGELKTLQKQLGAIPAPGLRYSSSLAKYLPVNTVVYAAIPNVGGTLSEAKRIFEERLSQSEVLRQWWQQQPASHNGAMDAALKQISALSQYLGNEIVFSVAATSAHQFSQPLFLAEVIRPGLEAYLQQNVPPDAKLSISVTDHLIVASPDSQQVQAVMQSLNGTAGGFVQTPFFQRIAQSYAIGAGYLLAVDMEQIVPKSVSDAKRVPPGMENARYLVLERRAIASDDTETRASLSFAGGRQGMASWLAAPGPMGSLDFVSPDANFAAAAVLKNPLTIVQELISYASQAGSGTAQRLSELEEHLGVKLADDIAAPFGGDVTFAIDGPLVPVPSWKLAAEVYNPEHLRQTIATVIEHLNQQAGAESGKLLFTNEVVKSRTFYVIQNQSKPGLAGYFTFVDGYLLAGANEQLLLQAIENRQTGYTLVSSAKFQKQLPADGYTNFSAVIWHDAGKNLQALAEQVKSPQGSLFTLLASTGPGSICIYGEPERIVAATKGDFLGFNLNTLAGLGQGRSVPWLMASRQN